MPEKPAEKTVEQTPKSLAIGDVKWALNMAQGMLSKNNVNQNTIALAHLLLKAHDIRAHDSLDASQKA
jgi:hypothetical protein